jgi:cytidylate kinase
MYRAVGWYLLQQGIELEETEVIVEKLAHLELSLLPAVSEESDVGVFLNGEDITEVIRTAEMAMVASRVSALPVVRRVLTEIQRGYGEKGGIVAEGRDTGTVVFPRAAYKFFLDARPEERAKRRVLQLQARGVAADFKEILTMTLERDENDSQRAIAPLKRAEDAVLIDTTERTIPQVVDDILRIIEGKKKQEK